MIKLPVSSYPDSWYETHCAECGIGPEEKVESVICEHDGKKLCKGTCYARHMDFYHQSTSIS
ncbi:MAG: hypothetical protein KGI08_08625 [Thaumarchaeota archaeon]|nr:hypothetical protein [Nitrososphaerota archaeon]